MNIEISYGYFDLAWALARLARKAASAASDRSNRENRGARKSPSNRAESISACRV